MAHNRIQIPEEQKIFNFIAFSSPFFYLLLRKKKQSSVLIKFLKHTKKYIDNINYEIFMFLIIMNESQGNFLINE